MSNLGDAFKAMRKMGLYARQNYLCCQSCAGCDAAHRLTLAIDEKPEKRPSIMGCVYYTRQDAEAFRDGRDLYLAYGEVETAKYGRVGRPAVEVGQMVCQALDQYGVKYEWNGNPDTRIRVKAASVR